MQFAANKGLPAARMQIVLALIAQQAQQLEQHPSELLQVNHFDGVAGVRTQILGSFVDSSAEALAQLVTLAVFVLSDDLMRVFGGVRRLDAVRVRRRAVTCE